MPESTSRKPFAKRHFKYFCGTAPLDQSRQRRKYRGPVSRPYDLGIEVRACHDRRRKMDHLPQNGRGCDQQGRHHRRSAKRGCLTESLKLHGWQEGLDPLHPMSTYGTFSKEIKSLARVKKDLAKRFASPTCPILLPRLFGVCAPKWQGQSKMPFRAAHARYCWTRKRASRSHRMLQS